MTLQFIRDKFTEMLPDFRDSKGVHILDSEDFYTYIRALMSERYNEFLKDFNEIK